MMIIGFSFARADAGSAPDLDGFFDVIWAAVADAGNAPISMALAMLTANAA